MLPHGPAYIEARMRILLALTWIAFAGVRPADAGRPGQVNLTPGSPSDPVLADTLFGGTRRLLKIGTSTGFVIEPPQSASGGGRPWVWYAPTFIDKYPNQACAWYLGKLIQKGFWVAGLDVGESYGNPAGRRAFTAFYDTLRARYRLNAKACLMPQSRGGLMLYNWAADSGNARKVARIAGIYTVGDLRSYPGLSVAAPAYGMTVSELEDHLVEHNPIDRLGPLRDEGIEIFHLHGDADALVPMSKNSQVVHDRYAALGGRMILEVVPGKGHAEIPEFFQSQNLLDFILAELETTANRMESGPGPEPGPEPHIRPGPRNRDSRGYSALGRTRIGRDPSSGKVFQPRP